MNDYVDNDAVRTAREQLARELSDYAGAEQKRYVSEINRDGAAIAKEGVRLYGADRWEQSLKTIAAEVPGGDLTNFTDFLRGLDAPTEVVKALSTDENLLKEFKDAPLHRQHAIAAGIQSRAMPSGYAGIGSQPAWRNPATEESFLRDGGRNIPNGKDGDRLWNELFDATQAKRAAKRGR